MHPRTKLLFPTPATHPPLSHFVSAKHPSFQSSFVTINLPFEIYYPGQKNWDSRAHVAQARDLSSMHAPMFGLRACLNFFGQGSILLPGCGGGGGGDCGYIAMKVIRYSLSTKLGTCMWQRRSNSCSLTTNTLQWSWCASWLMLSVSLCVAILDWAWKVICTSLSFNFQPKKKKLFCHDVLALKACEQCTQCDM